MQRLLYGPLRQIETEQLYEKAWFAVTETCLAMTIFRGEVGGWFLVMFVCLLVGKVWGWIGEGRVEILEQQPPANPRLFHTRLAISLILSVAFNCYLLEYSIQTVLRQARPDMMVMFGFEFAILTILSSSTAARYTISLVEIYITRKQKQAKLEERRLELRAARTEALRNQAQSESNEPGADLPDENNIDEAELDVPGWEEKGRWVFYLDLVTGEALFNDGNNLEYHKADLQLLDFFKLVVYLSFFAILFTFYGLPIHILRDVVLTVRSFVRRIADFLRYRNATRDMNQRYPDATAEEVANEEVCIICREEMRPWDQPGQEGEAAAPGGAAAGRPAGGVPDRLRPKKLPCGHILHFACLRSWLERQQNCPTCRRPVVTTTRARIYPGQANDRGGNAGGGAGQQPDGQPPAGAGGQGQPRARVFNFGPLRVGFGAGRGDLFRNLAQGVQGGDVQGAQPNPNEPIQPGRQQIGFGFGFGRAPAPPANPTPNPQTNATNIQQQLNQIELQITQEINNLRATAEHLHTVRLLQAELARLRSAQTGPNGQGVVPTNPTGATATTHASQPIISSTIQRQFTVNPHAPTMRSGDSQIPQGMTIPEGWTLVPLQRVEQHQHHPGNLGQTGPPVNPTSSHAGAHPPAPFVSSSHISHTGLNPPTVTVPGHIGGSENSAPNQTNVNTTDTTHFASSTDVPASSTPTYTETTPGEAPETRPTETTGQTLTTDNATRSASPPLGSSWTEVSSDGLLDKQEVRQPMASSPHGEGSEENGHTNGYAEESAGSRDEKGKGKAVSIEDVDYESN